MGRDKALLPVDGVPMAVRVADALQAAGARSVTALGGDAAGLAAAGLTCAPDLAPGGGPLPATMQALESADSDLVAVLSCDLLAPDADTIRALVDALAARPGALAAVPHSEGHLQWTHAVWRTGAASALRTRYAAGDRSLRRAAAGLPILEVEGLPVTALADADEPADLDRT